MRHPLFAVLRAGAVAALATASVTSIGRAQTGVHPVTGRQYAQTMSVEGAPWLERREREREEDPDLGLRLLKVAKGSTVGDVGAGSGYMSLRLARLVGAPAGASALALHPGIFRRWDRTPAKGKGPNVVRFPGTSENRSS